MVAFLQITLLDEAVVVRNVSEFGASLLYLTVEMVTNTLDVVGYPSGVSVLLGFWCSL